MRKGVSPVLIKRWWVPGVMNAASLTVTWFCHRHQYRRRCHGLHGFRTQPGGGSGRHGGGVNAFTVGMRYAFYVMIVLVVCSATVSFLQGRRPLAARQPAQQPQEEPATGD